MNVPTSHRTVRETPLSAKQDALLHSLERQVQLKMQAETHASLLRSQQDQDVTNTLQEFVMKQMSKRQAAINQTFCHIDPSFVHLKSQMDNCMSQWNTIFTHAHMAQALVTEMETSHVQVTTKTQALYRNFEDILEQVDTLETRVATIAAPLPYFTAIEEVAHVLGFGVKFAAPSSSASNLKSGHTLMENATNSKSSSSAMRTKPMDSTKAVQVFQHQRGIDPTTQTFQQALEKIDSSIAYLKNHLEYKDSACFLDAYRILAAGGIKCLKEYAISGLEAAKDAVYEALQKEATESPPGSSSAGQLDETSAYYVNFQLVAPALAAVAKQLERLNGQQVQESAENLRVLGEVVDAYATQRGHLLFPVFSTWLNAVSQTSDIANMLRVSCAQLLKVCEAEFRLFLNLFGHDPSDELFVFLSEKFAFDDVEERNEENENAFERLIFQLCGLLYNTVRPQLLVQKDLEVLCEVIQVLRSEVIEAAITPRAALVGNAEPVMHRMIQDAQERLILCMQKYIRDEIEGFVPTPADLNYPAKLVTAEQSGMSFYDTWYPSLEHTLMCLSKGYHFVKMEVFEELAQDAIQICTASLKMASADISATQGRLHGALFLVKHLLTLREQITPFEIQFAQKSKALDFTSSADAMNELLEDATTLFRRNGLVDLFTRGIPQIQETTADVKKELEHELKKSCTAFIEIVLQQLAEPLLALMKQIARVQQAEQVTALDFRQCAFTAPVEVDKVLASVSLQLRDKLPGIQETIRLYLRNASTETILFKPVQRNLVDAVENLKKLMEQTYTREELEPCDEIFGGVLQQLHAI